MKKLTVILLSTVFLFLFGCSDSEKKPNPPAPLEESSVFQIRATVCEKEYDVIFSGSGNEESTMKVTYPDALSFLEFKIENGKIISVFDGITLADEHADIPLRELFSVLLEASKKIGTAEYTFENGQIIYRFGDGYSLCVGNDDGLPISLSSENIKAKRINNQTG